MVVLSVAGMFIFGGYGLQDNLSASTKLQLEHLIASLAPSPCQFGTPCNSSQSPVISLTPRKYCCLTKSTIHASARWLVTPEQMEKPLSVSSWRRIRVDWSRPMPSLLPSKRKERLSLGHSGHCTGKWMMHGQLYHGPGLTIMVVGNRCSILLNDCTHHLLSSSKHPKLSKSSTIVWTNNKCIFSFKWCHSKGKCCFGNRNNTS